MHVHKNWSFTVIFLHLVRVCSISKEISGCAAQSGICGHGFHTVGGFPHLTDEEETGAYSVYRLSDYRIPGNFRGGEIFAVFAVELEPRKIDP